MILFRNSVFIDVITKEIKQVNPNNPIQEINPEYSLEGLMLKLQYFDHLIQSANSLPTPAYWVKIKVWSSMFLSVNSTNQWTYHSHTNQHTSADLIVLVTVLGIQNGARWEGWRPLSWQASPCVCPPSPPPSSSVFVFICHGSAGNFLCRNKGFYFFKKGVGGGSLA